MSRNRGCLFLFLIALMVFVPTLARSTVHYGIDDMHVDILADGGQTFPVYRVHHHSGPNTYRAYVEARDQENYAIRVWNRTDQRIGFVIAVDGRNIISGNKSYLEPNENMYILEPHQRAIYRGWRTSENQVHRFYFTDANESYAKAFGDDSALGVIAVAVYRQKLTYEDEKARFKSEERPGAGESRAAAPQPGTGFGNATTSQAIRVQFDPEPAPIAKYFFKYEWRERLCDKGIVWCGRPVNRFWPENEWRKDYSFAPYPPGYTR